MSTFTIIEEDEKKASTGNNTDDIAVLPFEGPEKRWKLILYLHSGIRMDCVHCH